MAANCRSRPKTELAAALALGQLLHGLVNAPAIHRLVEDMRQEVQAPGLGRMPAALGRISSVDPMGAGPQEFSCSSHRSPP